MRGPAVLHGATMAATDASVCASLPKVLGVRRVRERLLLVQWVDVFPAKVPIRIQLRQVVVRALAEGVLLVLPLALARQLNYLLRGSSHVRLPCLQLRRVLALSVARPVKDINRDQV